jgi:hypothetical protein
MLEIHFSSKRVPRREFSDVIQMENVPTKGEANRECAEVLRAIACQDFLTIDLPNQASKIADILKKLGSKAAAAAYIQEGCFHLNLGADAQAREDFENAVAIDSANPFGCHVARPHDAALACVSRILSSPTDSFRLPPNRLSPGIVP